MTEREFAERVAARTQEVPCGIDPVTVVTIVCALLGLLMNCFRFWYPQGVTVADVCEDEHVKRRLIRRAARQVQKKHPELSRDDARLIAAATVEEAISTPEGQVTEYAAGLREPTSDECLLFKGIDDGDE